MEDVNDNAPICVEKKPTTIDAGFYDYLPIVFLSCTDADVGINRQLVYKLNSSSVLLDGHFIINQTSAELGLEGGIAAGNYTVQVIVSDLGKQSLQTTHSVEVKVLGDGGERESYAVVLIVLLVVFFLALVGVVVVCELCCCYWSLYYRVNKQRRHLNGFR